MLILLVRISDPLKINNTGTEGHAIEVEIVLHCEDQIELCLMK